MISRIFFIIALTFGSSIGLFAQQTTTQLTTRPTSQPTSQPTHEGGKMSFDQKFIDLGRVTKGETRKFEFSFSNIGNAPIKIDLVSSCDCTTTDYPTSEIKPGDSGKILVTFDSTEKEESETIDIDIFLTNEDPKTGAPIIEMLQYKYELIQ